MTIPDWQSQVALVTGARGGIGAAVVTALLNAGARVSAADLAAPLDDRPNERLNQVRLDVTDSRAVDSWVAAASEQWGRPTIAVIAAGVAGSTRLVDTSDEEWRDVMSVNLDSVFYTARAVVREMTADPVGGRIVVIGSWAADHPHPHIGAYSSSKAAVRALVQTLALDHASDGLIVNEVAPGIVEAGLSKSLFEHDAALKARTEAAIPIGRLMTPADVARDVLHLCSPDNHHTTGVSIVSDGGLSLASLMNHGRS